MRFASIKVGERQPQSVGRMLARIAATQDQQYRCVDQRAREVTKQQQRGRFGPLEIVEHQDQRSRHRDPAQQVGCRLEREEPLGRVVGVGWCRRRRDPRRERRTDAEQLTAVSRDVFGDDAGRGVFDDRGKHAPERLEGCTGLVASSVRSGRAPRRNELLSELREQGGLADPRLSTEHDAAQAGRGDQRELARERLHLFTASDEPARVRKRAREWDVDGVLRLARFGRRTRERR